MTYMLFFSDSDNTQHFLNFIYNLHQTIKFTIEYAKDMLISNLMILVLTLVIIESQLIQLCVLIVGRWVLYCVY